MVDIAGADLSSDNQSENADKIKGQAVYSQKHSGTIVITATLFIQSSTTKLNTIVSFQPTKRFQ
ncbi:hypothetical protein PLUTE_b0887 [Pseudoalteromonas luteoviolacea DSM 6061]|nr:hypothetical protein [Pseudoalteromonas luteoviolacea DSM 6061]